MRQGEETELKTVQNGGSSEKRCNWRGPLKRVGYKGKYLGHQGAPKKDKPQTKGLSLKLDHVRWAFLLARIRQKSGAKQSGTPGTLLAMRGSPGPTQAVPASDSEYGARTHHPSPASLCHALSPNSVGGGRYP